MPIISVIYVYYLGVQTKTCIWGEGTFKGLHQEALNKCFLCKAKHTQLVHLCVGCLFILFVLLILLDVVSSH